MWLIISKIICFVTTRELIDKLAQVAPDTEIIGGTWNGRVDTYTVLDPCMVFPFEGVSADFVGTPGAFDKRLLDIRSKDVVYLGSLFDELDEQVISDRRFLRRLSAILQQHCYTQWMKDRIYCLLQEFYKR